MTTERRSFTLDQHAISMFIRSQAGSLQKGNLEAVANALDAGSSHVKVDLDAERVVIEDNGRGFKSKKELVKFFERFGFDHTNLDRKVGRFGVGGGQLFHFGKNLWTTHGLVTSVPGTNERNVFGDTNPGRGVYRKLIKKGLVYRKLIKKWRMGFSSLPRHACTPPTTPGATSKETRMSTTPRAGEGCILEARKENHRSLFPQGFSRFPGRL